MTSVINPHSFELATALPQFIRAREGQIAMALQGGLINTKDVTVSDLRGYPPVILTLPPPNETSTTEKVKEYFDDFSNNVLKPLVINTLYVLAVVTAVVLVSACYDKMFPAPLNTLQQIAAGESAAKKILGVPPQASDRDIKTAYRALSLEHHPDKNSINQDYHAKITTGVNLAYECLKTNGKLQTCLDIYKSTYA